MAYFDIGSNDTATNTRHSGKKAAHFKHYTNMYPIPFI